MIKQVYPRIEINLEYLKENVKSICELAKKEGVEIAGVIKGTTGIPECAKMFQEGGSTMIASSRLEQLEDATESGITLPKLLLRIPMLSETSEVVRVSDYSLNSELEVLLSLNDEAKKQNKTHNVIIMADLGDLREGFWDKEEMVDVCEKVEKEMSSLNLAGVGVNLGCYGSILATNEKLEELVAIAEKVEERIGRKLQYISGGATSSVMRLLDGDLPKRVNLLRVGEGILLARDLDVFYGYNVSWLHQDVYTLKAEIIEIKDKPTHPVGTIAVDAFGHRPTYVDRGIRKRALLGIGKVDYGSIDEIFPKEEGIEIVGASSDHTIIDIEDYKGELKLGDIISFDIDYASLVYVTSSRNTQIVFV